MASKIRFLLPFVLISFFTCAQTKDSLSITTQTFKINDSTEYTYSRPKFIDLIRYIPDDLVGFGKFTIQKENLKWDALAIGSTLAIIPYDQKILEDSEKVGRRIGGWDRLSRYKRVLGIEIVPTSISSGVYYFGNGNTTLLLSGFFYAVGKIGKDDYRALNTSSELIEVLLSVGVATQTIKRISGRQSPIAATQDGGAWHPFTSFTAFASDTPNYDAMPSGHIATYVATLAVIATNYPEIKWIKPVGYTLGTALAFNMVSGKVHWASDYPIAILLGYVIGKNAADRRITKTTKNSDIIPHQTKYKTS
ncbi:MAG: phosphatase PAP2 family protein [Flavobacterium sp.]|nr:phosphatase PAP2 family protein [Flavobacterium sp.]